METLPPQASPKASVELPCRQFYKEFAGGKAAAAFEEKLVARGLKPRRWEELLEPGEYKREVWRSLTTGLVTLVRFKYAAEVRL